MLKLSKKKKRKIFLKMRPDVFFHSYWFVKFTNKLMQRVRKASVEKIILRVFKKFKIEYHKNALKVFFLNLIKSKPFLGFATIRLGLEKKKIPIPLSPRRQLILSLAGFVALVKSTRLVSKDTSIEEILYTQLKAIMHQEKTILIKRSIEHTKELIENRLNLHFRKKVKR